MNFGKFSDCRRRDVVMKHKKYTEWCIKTASANEEECCPNLREFANYATGRHSGPPPLIRSDDSIAEPSHD